MTREEAWQVVCEFTESDSLRKHMLAVEASMAFYAEKYGEDVERWRVVGLLHDFDYEKHPTAEEHPIVGMGILRERAVSEEIVRAIGSHADRTGIPRESLMEKALFACDELSGFITAVAYVRPNRSLSEVEVASVKKKLKDKAFARQVSREDIVKGAEELGLPLDEHIENCIHALRREADVLGL